MSGLSCPYGYGAQYDCASGLARREVTPYQSYQMGADDNVPFPESKLGKDVFGAVSAITGSLAGKEKEAPKTQPAAPKWVKYAISGVVLALLAGGWMVLKKD